MNDQSALNCHQVSRRAAFTHLESAWQTYHSLRAGETDGVEANSKYLQIISDVVSLLDTRTAKVPQCVLVWPLCWCTEREVQAEAAAAGGLQQCGHCGEMLQEGI